MKRVFFSVVPVLILFVLVGAFFWQTLVRGYVPVPTDALIGLYHPWRDLYAATNPRGVPYKNFLITDPFRQQIPWKKEVIDSWKAGKLPIWDPFSFSGTPLIANVQAAIWYPLNVFFLVLPFLSAWSLSVIVQLLFASAFSYLYFRTLTLSRVASFVGALLWTFSGFSVAWLTWGTIVQTAVWIPLGLAAIEMLGQKKQAIRTSFAWTLVLATALSCQLFAGHAQVAIYGWVITLAYMVWRGVRPWHGLAWLMTLALTSVVWVPMVSFFTSTGRSIAPVWQKEGWFLPWEHLAQFLAPDFFGNPATGNYWGKWNYGEFIGFVGSAGVVFALLGGAFHRVKERFFFLVVLGLSLLFLLPNPIAELPFRLHIPLISSLQPTRLMVMVDLALVVLAAYGVDWWWENPKRKRVWPAIVGLSMFYLALWAIVFFLGRWWPAGAGWLAISKRNLVIPTVSFVGIASALGFSFFYGNRYGVKIACMLVIVGISLLELFRFGWKFTPFTPTAYFFPETGVIRYLVQQKPPFRVLSVDERILPPNTSTYYGIENAEGYDPLFSKRYQEFMGTLQTGDPVKGRLYDFNRIVTVKNLGSPLFQILGVSYVVSIDPLKEYQFEKVYEEGATKVYKYDRALPRAFFVSNVRVIPTEHVLSSLFDTTFIPDRDAIIEKDPGIENSTLAASEKVTMEKYEKGDMILRTQIQKKRLLVLTQSYSPFLHVAIDGVETTVYPTDYIFCGVVVPAGEHSIRLEYRVL